MIYTFENTVTGRTVGIEGDVTPAAILKAREVLAYPENWTFDGMALDDWLDAARTMFAIQA